MYKNQLYHSAKLDKHSLRLPITKPVDFAYLSLINMSLVKSFFFLAANLVDMIEISSTDLHALK